MNPINYSDMDKIDSPMEETMEGNQLKFDASEYPELEDIKQGASVEIRCQGKVSANNNGQVAIDIVGQCDISTEGQADKAMKQMSEQSYKSDQSNGSNESDF